MNLKRNFSLLIFLQNQRLKRKSAYNISLFLSSEFLENIINFVITNTNITLHCIVFIPSNGYRSKDI